MLYSWIFLCEILLICDSDVRLLFAYPPVVGTPPIWFLAAFGGRNPPDLASDRLRRSGNTPDLASVRLRRPGDPPDDDPPDLARFAGDPPRSSSKSGG